MKNKNSLISRKFILTEEISQLRKLKEINIEEGYFLGHPTKGAKICSRNKKYFISFGEKEIALTKTQFDSLWPYSEGQRVKFKRSFFLMKGLKMKIDSFLGEHAPLRLVEVFFSAQASSRSFEKPSFFGEEVTSHEEYNTISMALYGVPEEGMSQIGILPYTFRDKKLLVLLITSSSGNRWILPKGRQEPDMTPHEVAAMEAVEEGGVLGTLRHDLRLRCEMESGRVLQLYPMKISKLLGSWPEEHFRLRRLVPINDAISMIEDPQIARSIKYLGNRLKK